MDDEIKGEGNSANYRYRMHDPRIGRFFACDPLEYKYCYNSPYAFSENQVIDAIELEGLEKKVVITNNNATYHQYVFKSADAIKANILNNPAFGPIVKELLKYNLVNNSSSMYFNDKYMYRETFSGSFGTKNPVTVCYLVYQVRWDLTIENETYYFDIDIPIVIGAVTHMGGKPIDYLLALLGTGFYAQMYKQSAMKSFYSSAVTQIFSNFYGTTRGLLLEKLVATAKYKSWVWLEDIASNFPVFDFIKGDVYASFKTWKAESFSLSTYKGYVDKIKDKITNGFTFKDKKYTPKEGVLDILVPKSSLDDFLKEGGKHYKEYQELIKYGQEKGVKIKLGASVE